MRSGGDDGFAPPGLGPGRRWSEILGVVVALLLFLAVAPLLVGAAQEDTFIYLRYALNAARGDGLVFNRGEWVEGFSSPLWMAVLVGLAHLPLDLPMAASLASLACGAAVVALTPRLGARLGLGPGGRVGAALLVALSHPFAWWARSGLDTTFYALMLTVFCLVYLDGEYGPAAARPGRQRLGGLLLLRVAASRPEGVLLAPVVGWDRWRANDRAGLRRYAGVFLVGLAGLLLLRWMVYGALLPNTGTKLLPERALRGAWQSLAWVAYLGGLPVALPVLALWRGDAPAVERRRATFLLAVVLVVSVAFLIACGGDYLPRFRFLVPTLPLLAVLCWWGLARLNGPGGRPLRGWAAAVACLAIALAASLVEHREALRDHPRSGRWWREWADPLANTTNFHVVATRWILDHVPPGSLVAYGQMGKAPYYALVEGRDLAFLDTLGLVDRRVAALNGYPLRLTETWRQWTAGRSLADAEAAARAAIAARSADYVVRERRPDFVIVEYVLRDLPLLRAVVDDREFQATYRLVATLPDPQRPAFLIYQRVRQSTAAALAAPPR